MNRLLIVMGSSLVLAVAAIIASGQDMKESGKSKYKVGQKWSYSARPGEERSYLIILKIDNDDKLGRIIHIAIRGLKIKNPRSPDGLSDSVNHMPFSEAAIEKSGLRLLADKTDLPDYADGYRMWREAFDDGRAGIYTITVAEAVDVMEAVLNK